MSARGYRRAPANGAPDRYAAVPDLRVKGLDSGGSTPLATALGLAASDGFLAFESVTTGREGVTYVLNLNRYRCIDCALRFLWCLVIDDWLFNVASHSRQFA